MEGDQTMDPELMKIDSKQINPKAHGVVYVPDRDWRFYIPLNWKNNSKFQEAWECVFNLYIKSKEDVKVILFDNFFSNR